MKNPTEKTILSVALIAAGSGAAYLTWRIGWTLGAPAWLAIPLVVAEALGLVRFVLQVATRAPAPGAGVEPGPRGSSRGRVEMLVPAVGASADEVAQTLAIAVPTVDTPIRVLDTVHRDDVAREAARLGATYEVFDALDAPGLIDQAWTTSTTDLIAWVDAGDVPVPGLLDLASAFDDATLAVVQAATDLQNRDSLLHLSPHHDERAIESAVEGPSLDRCGSARWNGSGSLVRLSALHDIGGLGAGRGTAATTRAARRFARLGLSIRFCATPLVRTVAPDTLDEYLAEAGDRALGAWSALWSSDSPLRPGRGSLRGRLAQLHAATTPLDGAIRLTYYGVLAAVLFTGKLPIDAPVALAAALFVPQLVLRGAATLIMSRGTLGLGEATRQSLRLMGTHLGSLVRRPHRHDATRAARWKVLGRLPLLTSLGVVINVALIIRAATFIWPDLLPTFSVGARVAVMAAAVWASLPIIDVMQVLVTRNQRRQVHRVETELVAELDQRQCRVVDITPNGIGLVLAQATALNTTSEIRLDLPRLDGSTTTVTIEGRLQHTSDTSANLQRVGYSFTNIERSTRDALVEFCALTAADRDTERSTTIAASPERLHVNESTNKRRGFAVLSIIGVLSATLVVMGGPASAAPSGGEGTATISGIVLDDTATPAPNMCVWIPNHPEIMSGYTDANGAYTMTSVPAGDYEVQADDCGNGNFVRTKAPSSIWDQRDVATFTVADGESVTAPELTLVRAAHLIGTVSDDQGNPVGGACVSMQATDSNGEWFWVTGTQPDGSVSGIVPAGFEFKIQYWDCNQQPELQTVWYPSAPTADSATPVKFSAGEKRQLDVTMPHGAIVTGTITDEAGNPLQNICVSANSHNGNDSSYLGGSNTNEKGVYRFAVVPGKYSLWANDCSGHPQYISRHYRGRPGLWGDHPEFDMSMGDNGPYDFTMTTGGRLGGHVTDAAGDPATDVCVALNPKDLLENNSWDNVSWTRVNPDGSWISNYAPVDDYYIQYVNCDNNNHYVDQGQWIQEFRPDVYPSYGGSLAAAQTVAVTAGTDRLDIDNEMTKSAAVFGNVVDDSGNPVSGVCLGGGPSDGSTDASGAFGGQLFPAVYNLTFTDCTPGRGLVQASRTVDLTDGATHNVQVTMHQGSTHSISGSVRNQNGTAIPLACAAAFVSPNVISGAMANPDGTFSIDGLGAGTYHVGVINCMDPGLPMLDPDTGASYWPTWFDNAPIVIQNAPPDPVAQGATAVVISDSDATGIDFCLGDCPPPPPATTTTTAPPTTTTIAPTTTLTTPTTAPATTTVPTTAPATTAITTAPTTAAPSTSTTSTSAPKAASPTPVNVGPAPIATLKSPSITGVKQPSPQAMAFTDAVLEVLGRTQTNSHGRIGTAPTGPSPIEVAATQAREATARASMTWSSDAVARAAVTKDQEAQSAAVKSNPAVIAATNAATTATIGAPGATTSSQLWVVIAGLAMLAGAIASLLTMRRRQA